MDAVELEELAVSLTDLLFHMPLPEVSSQAVGSIRLFVQGDVIRAFEPDDVIALELVARITAGVGFLEQGDAEFAERGAQGIEVTEMRRP